MAYEIGIPYELVGPEGSRVVFNDRTDPDFIGFLSAEDGITGLDSPDVTDNGDTLAGADGGLNGLNTNGRRPITMKGIIDTGLSRTLQNAAQDELTTIIDAARKADAVLRWQETGRVRTKLNLRRNVPPRISGRIPKTFFFGLVSEYDRIVSDAEKSTDIIPGAVASGGMSSPLTSPLTSGASAVGSAILNNAGRKGAHPRLRIEGPIVNPVFLNYTTGERITLLYTLNAGEYIEIETRPGKRYARLQGSANADRWGSIDFSSTTWWELAPGNNDIRLLAFSYSAGAKLTVYWRDTWIG